MKPRIVIIFAVVVLAVVAGAIWFLQQQPPGAGSVVSATPPPVEYKPNIVDAGNVPSAPVPRVAAAPPRQAAAPAPAAPPRELTDWERKIDDVLNSKADELGTARMLINLVPTLPPEGQAEATQHITNLILDKDYGNVLPMLRNPALPEEVQDVLVTDLMNREDPVKLPALLEVARIPNHPYHEEAMTDLQIFLDQDNGTNWGKWGSAVNEYLRKQAAEEAAANAPEPAAK